jgi:hypothetical protein
MSFSRFLTSIGTIKRLKKTITNGRTIEAWDTIADRNIKASVQPVSEELIATGQGDFYNSFTIYFEPNTDVQIGDKYIITDDVEFIIKGIKFRNYGIRIKLIEASALRK